MRKLFLLLLISVPVLAVPDYHYEKHKPNPTLTTARKFAPKRQQVDNTQKKEYVLFYGKGNIKSFSQHGLTFELCAKAEDRDKSKTMKCRIDTQCTFKSLNGSTKFYCTKSNDAFYVTMHMNATHKRISKYLVALRNDKMKEKCLIWLNPKKRLVTVKCWSKTRTQLLQQAGCGGCNPNCDYQQVRGR